MNRHSGAGTAVSALKKGLRPSSQDGLAVIDDVVYHEYGMPTSQEECDALGVSCQNGSSGVLRNHGLLSAGTTIPCALRLLYMLERACESEIITSIHNDAPSPHEHEVYTYYHVRANAYI